MHCAQNSAFLFCLSKCHYGEEERDPMRRTKQAYTSSMFPQTVEVQQTDRFYLIYPIPLCTQPQFIASGIGGSESLVFRPQIYWCITCVRISAFLI